MSGRSEAREAKMQEIQDKIIEGTKAIFESENYKDYLLAMSKFPRYSINNCILIVSQYPEASLVCGYRHWQTEFNRNVNRGEKGIMILAPIKYKADVEEELYDENNRLVRDENGQPVTETVTREFESFRPVYVFDVAQTSGDPIPSLVSKLTDAVEGFEELKAILMEVSPVPISFEAFKGEANGYFSPSEQKIVIKNSLPELQTIKTMIHEIAHATLGHGSKDDEWDRETKEVQAESVAYWVSQMLGLDTSEYSFGYISGWSKDKEVSELKEHLDLIKTTADEISRKIEEKLLALHEESEEEPKKANHR